MVDSQSWAAFTSQNTTAFGAGVTFIANGSYRMDLVYKSISDPSATPLGLTWKGITVGQTSGWITADTYIILHSTISLAGTAIQIYTDNKNGTDFPSSYGGGEPNPSGLYSPGNPGIKPLPMAWRIVDKSTHTSTSNPPSQPGFKPALTVMRGTADLPDRLWVQEIGPDYPCFLWVVDKSVAGFPSLDASYDPSNMIAKYIKIKDSGFGIHHSEEGWGRVSSPDYLYFSADFTNAVNVTYASNLTIELFQE